MFIAKDLKNDSDNKGSVLGWGVVKNAPWSLSGVYATKEEANAKALVAGDGYEVKYGSHRLGSDDFVSGQ
ncbi:Uncharacterised protein [Serratia proteamaculans]|uniref:hypothetical protein n=1 Tax=Serratia proteamaculans TaxID=28151 RepID=UPI002177FA77|nr:hypothetical protein [Serratia proteamaculans]CAI0838053.1 Uncharacterised protein [Serratia proteamaculans]CAI1625358.1 Uncharacterised protein [Serratia proteamaculans]